jgi:hypothetical protein
MSAEKVPPELPAQLGSWKDEEAALHKRYTARPLYKR